VPTPARFAARQARGSLAPLYLGEGPVWDGATDRLLWVEISGGTVFVGTLSGDEVVVDHTHQLDGTVGAVLPATDGGLVVAGPRGLVLIDPSGVRSDGPQLIPPGVRSRLNDAACDPAGRLLVGSVRLDGRSGDESLWSVDGDGRVATLVTGLTCSNGIGFSPDGSSMYLVDSLPGSIRAFDYDVSNGACGAAREVWSGDDGLPDGLNVDTDGNLWVAFFYAGEVRCLTPQGETVAVVEIPVPNPTCASFVGPSRDLLLVTTAREKLDETQLARWPDSGALFVADVQASGLPATAWAGSTVGHTHSEQPSPTIPKEPR
jgi:sugar lactone lactonase YvrE